MTLRAVIGAVLLLAVLSFSAARTFAGSDIDTFQATDFKNNRSIYRGTATMLVQTAADALAGRPGPEYQSNIEVGLSPVNRVPGRVYTNPFRLMIDTPSQIAPGGFSVAALAADDNEAGFQWALSGTPTLFDGRLTTIRRSSQLFGANRLTITTDLLGLPVPHRVTMGDTTNLSAIVNGKTLKMTIQVLTDDHETSFRIRIIANNPY